MKAIIWILMGVLYFIIYALALHLVGPGTVCGAVVAAVGYGLWRLGQCWVGRLRG